MANLEVVLQQLREEHKSAEEQLQKLQSAISALEGVNGRGSRGKGRLVSALARQRMAAAQRARWARTRQGATGAKGSSKPAGRSPLSAAARKRIAAAQRVRWAKYRAEQQKQAA